MNKQKENDIILYQDEDGITRISVRFANESSTIFWGETHGCS